MSNYRRLISYIYAYEGGVKGKNIGYAKIEVRGDQCRIQVNVKKVYVGSNDIGVYLLSPGTEIMLGKIFIRGGAGEFRVSVHSGNVEGSGYSMDQCYGLTVHDVESTWQCYTTIWDDAVIQAAELGEDYADDVGNAEAAGGVGNTGDAGAAGAAGNAGVVGAAKRAVETGIAGGAGRTAETGIAGGDGRAVETGIAGGAGRAVETGIAGGVGRAAETGIAGGAGRAVETGIAGGSGSVVDAGIAGVAGRAAETGIVGSTGRAVETGIVGAAKRAVETGIAGAAGSVADAGIVGAAGSTVEAGSARESGGIRDTRSAGGQPMRRIMGDVTEKAAEIELADVTSENVRAKEVPAKIPAEPGNGADLSTLFPVSAEIERELSEEEARLANVAPWDQEEAVKKEEPLDIWLPEPAEETLIGSMEKSAERMMEVSSKMRDYIGELADSVVEESMEGLQETIMENPSLLGTDQGEVAAEAIAGAVLEPETAGLDIPGLHDGVNREKPDSPNRQKPDIPISSARMMQEAVQQAIQALMGGIMTGPEKPASRGGEEPETREKRKPASRTAMEPETRAEAESELSPGTESEFKEDTEPAVLMPGGEEKPEQIKPVSPPPEPGDPAQLEYLDRMEKEASEQNHIWNQLGRRYPRVLAFDYDYGCEILSIKPQDIGLLPREVWVYGNNSFLLHGYYNYRHLILAKLNNPKGRPRYLLGVPGHYFSNEKYMASMFGFPNFVLAKKQPEADGRYGYWYTDIRM